MGQSAKEIEAFKGQNLHKKLLCLLRGAISIYCIAMIVAMHLNPSTMSIFDHFLAANVAQTAATVYLAVTVLLMLTGMSLGPTAILLALYIFASRPMELPALASPEDLQALVRDVSLVVLLYVFAIFASVSSQRAPSWRHRQVVAPRRVKRTAKTTRVERPAPDDETVLTREKILSGELLPPIPVQIDEPEAEDNLFANVFDLHEERLQRA